MTKFIVKKEHDYDGIWFMVYVNGQSITGFRDNMDAHVYGAWYTNPNYANLSERQSDLHGSSNNS